MCDAKDKEISKLTRLLEERDDVFQSFADSYHKQFERYERGYCINSDVCKDFQRCITFVTDEIPLSKPRPRYGLKDDYNG